MRVRSAVLSTVLMAVLLVPTGAWARRVTVTGTVSFELLPAVVVADQLVVTAITANPSLEKDIVQQLPRPGGAFVLPFFVNQETTNPLPSDLDTILFITNVSSFNQGVRLTLRSLSGSVLTTVRFEGLVPNETRIIRLSDVLP